MNTPDVAAIGFPLESVTTVPGAPVPTETA